MFFLEYGALLDNVDSGVLPLDTDPQQHHHIEYIEDLRSLGFNNSIMDISSYQDILIEAKNFLSAVLADVNISENNIVLTRCLNILELAYKNHDDLFSDETINLLLLLLGNENYLEYRSKICQILINIETSLIPDQIKPLNSLISKIGYNPIVNLLIAKNIVSGEIADNVISSILSNDTDDESKSMCKTQLKSILQLFESNSSLKVTIQSQILEFFRSYKDNRFLTEIVMIVDDQSFFAPIVEGLKANLKTSFSILELENENARLSNISKRITLDILLFAKTLNNRLFVDQELLGLYEQCSDKILSGHLPNIKIDLYLGLLPHYVFNCLMLLEDEKLISEQYIENLINAIAFNPINAKSSYVLNNSMLLNKLSFIDKIPKSSFAGVYKILKNNIVIDEVEVARSIACTFVNLVKFNHYDDEFTNLLCVKYLYNDSVVLEKIFSGLENIVGSFDSLPLETHSVLKNFALDKTNEEIMRTRSVNILSKIFSSLSQEDIISLSSILLDTVETSDKFIKSIFVLLSRYAKDHYAFVPKEAIDILEQFIGNEVLEEDSLNVLAIIAEKRPNLLNPEVLDYIKECNLEINVQVEFNNILGNLKEITCFSTSTSTDGSEIDCAIIEEGLAKISKLLDNNGIAIKKIGNLYSILKNTISLSYELRLQSINLIKLVTPVHKNIDIVEELIDLKIISYEDLCWFVTNGCYSYKIKQGVEKYVLDNIHEIKNDAKILAFTIVSLKYLAGYGILSEDITKTLVDIMDKIPSQATNIHKVLQINETSLPHQSHKKDLILESLISDSISLDKKSELLESFEEELDIEGINTILSLLPNKDLSRSCIKILCKNLFLLSEVNFQFSNEESEIISYYSNDQAFEEVFGELEVFLNSDDDLLNVSLSALHRSIMEKFPKLHITRIYISNIEQKLWLIFNSLNPEFDELFRSIMLNDMLELSNSPAEYNQFIKILASSETAIDDLMELLHEGKVSKLSQIIERLEIKWLSSSLNISDEVRNTPEFSEFINIYFKLKANNWTIKTLALILDKINDSNLDHFSNILRTIYEYKIYENERNKYGENLRDIIIKYDSNNSYESLEELESEIYSIASNKFDIKQENKDIELLQRLFALNSDFGKFSELLALLRNVHSNYTDSTCDYEVPIKDWTEEQVKSWATDLKSIFVRESGKESQELTIPAIDIAKMIAVLQRANYLNTISSIGEGNLLRDTQIVSLLLLLDSDIKNKGMLLQIATGEGKSTISAILAASLALLGNKVDIVTSSSVLASAGYNGALGFFDLLGLSAGINSDGDYGSGQKPCYLKDIVYGNALSFQSHFLSNTSSQGSMRGDREFAVAIIDEVDSMLIDSSNHVAKQVSPIPLMEFLLPLLAIAWNNFHISILPLNLEKPEMIVVSEEMINAIISNAPIPKYLVEYAKFQAKNWARNLVTAKLDLVLDKNYVINTNSEGKRVIHPVDSATGVTQENMVWENGLHQFLQIKHGCVVSPESLTVFFITNISYFKKYSKILGMTGTLGSESSQEFLKEIYDIDISFMPTYKDKQLVEMPGSCQSSKELLYKAICQKAYREAVSHNRAVLIVCETIKDSSELCLLLSTQCKGKARIINYSRSEKDLYNSEIESLTHPKTIIVATNLAGRGTDIKTSMVVEANGGLHVISAFIPNNAREEAQVKGRTARQGNNGSYEIITIDSSDRILGGRSDEEIISDKKIDRDAKEQEFIRNSITESVPNLLIQDDLYEAFSELYLECIEHRQNSLLSWPKEKQLIENFGLWIKTNKDLAASSIEKFISQARSQYQNAHFSNPSYLTQYFASNSRIPTMLSMIDKATAIDDIYNFAAHYYRARAWIDSHGESYKNNAIYALQDSVNRASEIIPFLTSMQIAVINEPNKESQLSEQITAKVEFLKSFIRNIEQIVDVISKSGEKEIRVSGYVKLQDVNDKLSKSDINEIVFLGIESFFEVESYKPKKDWSGTIFAACCSIAQIAIGALITIGSLGGAATLGVSIFSEGLMDAYKVGNAISKGQTIKMQDYLTSKAISYATIGAQVGISKLCEANNAVNASKISSSAKEAAIISEKMTVEEVRKAAIKQLILNSSLQLANTVAIEYAAKTLSKNIDENILDGLEDRISNAIYRSCNSVISEHNILFALQANIERAQIQKDSEQCVIKAVSTSKHASIMNELSSRALATASSYHGAAKGLSIAYEGGSKINAIAKVEPIIDYIKEELSQIIERSAAKASHRLCNSNIAYMDEDAANSSRDGLSKSLGVIASKCIMKMIERKVTMPLVSGAIRSFSDVILEDYRMEQNELLSVYSSATRAKNVHMTEGLLPNQKEGHDGADEVSKAKPRPEVRKHKLSVKHQSYLDFAKDWENENGKQRSVSDSSKSPKPVRLSSEAIERFMRRAGGEGFGVDDFIANNPPEGVDPIVWRASMNSKNYSNVSIQESDITKKTESEALHSVAQETMAIGEYYDSVAAEYPRATAFVEKASIVITPAVVGLFTPVPGAAEVGLALGVRSLLASEAINTVAGDKISEGIAKVRNAAAKILSDNFKLTDKESDGLAGATLFMGGMALGIRDNAKFASNLKTKHHREFGTRHHDDNSVFFNKSADDIGVGSKPTLHDHHHPSGEVISSDVLDSKMKLELHKQKIEGLPAEMLLKKGSDDKITGVKYTQRHHVVPQTLSDNPLFEKSGIDVEHRINKMLLPTTEGSKYTTTNRTVHQGRHVKEVARAIEEKMNNVLEYGKIEGYTQPQYRNDLLEIISEERSLLKSGDRILNKAKDHRKLRLEK